MSVIVRKAIKDDCKQMMKLVHELAIYEKMPQEVTVDFNHFIESGFGSNPVWWAFVAENEDAVIGFALYYIRFSTWKGQRMYVEDLLVTEKMRGKGIGKLLFEELIKEAKAKKLGGIAWQVLDWNISAINFYKKFPDVYIDVDGGWLNGALNF
jgi:GNAT superfamily N-acetyltransferase